MAKKKISKRGGYRPGSGRKPAVEPTELVSWHMRQTTIAAIKAQAAREGRQPGSVADEILSKALGVN